MTEQPRLDPEHFGQHYPSKLVDRLIRFSQNSSPRGISSHTASLIRSLTTRFAEKPLDLEAQGIRLRCFLDDNYSEKKFIFTPWRFDAGERQYIETYLPSDGVFVDIGANIGIYSLTALKALGKTGQLVAIEPNPNVYERLRFNIDANLSQDDVSPTICTLQCGVSDRNETLELYINQSNLGESSVRRSGRRLPGNDNDTQRPIQTIQCRPLLDILKELQLSRVDGIKIDIEGAEDKALVPYLEHAPTSLLARFILMENSETAWELPLSERLKERGYQRVKDYGMNSLYKLDPLESNTDS
ncbi:FkbM family methyltransferase [uncultured Halovibrio sp.]|uniref:FkbM family methyltransferase n=1 Tax=uncultured Halovibrio sp. TaxID=985049 RepID=UPI0025F676B3|nr:FkbM family methyltransferase [uncultured Halovibrio sp.]